MKQLNQLIALLFSIGTAMISYTINHSIFWSIMAFIFSPLAWIKWVIHHDVTLRIIQQTFSWFFN